jgi:hypothetical protein
MMIRIFGRETKEFRIKIFKLFPKEVINTIRTGTVALCVGHRFLVLFVVCFPGIVFVGCLSFYAGVSRAADPSQTHKSAPASLFVRLSSLF